MPDWSLQSARRAAHSIGVWFAWVVLTGHLTHDNLKRVTAAEAGKQLALMGLTFAVLGYVVFNFPPGAAIWVGGALVIVGGGCCIVVGGYLAITWYADYSLSA